MRTIHVALGEHAYDIEIAAGLLPAIGAKVRTLLPKAVRAAVISDTNVAPLYYERLRDSLQAAGLSPFLIQIEAGEQSKNMRNLSAILEELAQQGMTRSDVVLTLGGGVVGDLGGFAAASFMRGVAFIQVPTSLLAQIDSSVGGKVAVDLQAGKNLAGAFYQPKAVFIDTECLHSLSVRFLHDGLAEAIKYGCIYDAELFALIEGFADDDELLARIDEVVARCCAIKTYFVEQDEFDTGLRATLNFGHTLGHAIEQYYGYGGFTHGEGVAIGMYQLTKRTEELGLTAAGTAARLKSVLEHYSLPVQAYADRGVLLETMSHDKKKNGKSITLVTIKAIGISELLKLDFARVPEYLG